MVVTFRHLSATLEARAVSRGTNRRVAGNEDLLPTGSLFADGEPFADGEVLRKQKGPAKPGLESETRSQRFARGSLRQLGDAVRQARTLRLPRSCE